MTTVALAPPRALATTRPLRLMDFLFLASVFSVTFEKIHWTLIGDVSLADVTAVAFLAAFGLGRIGLRRQLVPRTVLVVSGFALAFLVVYLCGFYALNSVTGQDQFYKGLVKWGIHIAFLAAGVSYIARRGEHFYWRALGWFCAGIGANAVYGILQLLAAQAGFNLDAAFVEPITGGASSINIYGGVNGSTVYRPNALSGDPNHLGIFLVVPLLVLTPVYLRLERDHPWRRRLAWLLGFLLLVELATLSRSGLLGLAVGALVLAGPYRRKVRTRTFLAPVGAVALVIALVVAARWNFFSTVLRTRVDTSGGSESAHFQVYDFVPQVVRMHPLFGLGLNNFAVYYEQQTGKTNWGPHSFYVALIVETGLIGTLLFAVFLWYLFRRLAAARALGRALDARREPAAARVRPLAWGMTAALLGTMAANVFYLTLTFYYFYVFAMLALAAPVIFRRHLQRGP